MAMVLSKFVDCRVTWNSNQIENREAQRFVEKSSNAAWAINGKIIDEILMNASIMSSKISTTRLHHLFCSSTNAPISVIVFRPRSDGAENNVNIFVSVVE
ncbi:hypothetical protein HPP92_013416 [Vanilla planifolia]|uniref:Uncharacterized protein n=1 Tax=Vanilla planifolia TaxID=51239 RepID=A0A835R1X5_VANPL|nr:hypothetical protein HPP92_013844 [Vanilla planifolia]KAG0478697.1 hypothetical protein HPP92_013416 [Vanilla planifolia]